jgi:hypothetical protein
MRRARLSGATAAGRWSHWRRLSGATAVCSPCNGLALGLLLAALRVGQQPLRCRRTSLAVEQRAAAAGWPRSCRRRRRRREHEGDSHDSNLRRAVSNSSAQPPGTRDVLRSLSQPVQASQPPCV